MHIVLISVSESLTLSKSFFMYFNSQLIFNTIKISISQRLFKMCTETWIFSFREKVIRLTMQPTEGLP